ncbi:MAG: branched-chain amino acid ABC transporter permease [Verrucomicrobiales bacterium]|nr:branched-chain amino acid ABC transporter permease [Verrucomicrobiales bacterium]
MMNRPKTLLLVALGCCALLPLVGQRMNPYFLYVAYDVAINIILAVSLNLINGYTGQFSLGHAGFMAAGAYTAGVASTQLGPRLLSMMGAEGALAHAGVFLLALLLGGLAAALTGLLVGIPSLRLKGDYLAIVTLGFGEIIRVILQNTPAVGGSRGFSVAMGYTNLFWSFGLAVVTIYFVLTVVHSTYGRGFIAVHDDEVAAEAMGINTTRYKVTAFVTGAFFAGIAGGLYAHSKQFLTPTGFDFIKSIEIVVMVILGGMGNTFGVVLAAILLTLLPEVLRPVAQYRMVLYSLMLIVLMLTCPQGLFARIGSLLKRRFGTGAALEDGRA